MSVAGLYLLLNASFVAAAQVLVYVGAVNVLIIFAIMLVNKKEDLKPINDLKSRRIISTSICITLLSLLIRVDLTNVWILANPSNSIGEESTIRIGEHLFSDYLLPFEVASVLLLMAMIGAIVLTHSKREGVKRQNVIKQISRERSSAITLVDVEIGKVIKLDD